MWRCQRESEEERDRELSEIGGYYVQENTEILSPHLRFMRNRLLCLLCLLFILCFLLSPNL